MKVAILLIMALAFCSRQGSGTPVAGDVRRPVGTETTKLPIQKTTPTEASKGPDSTTTTDKTKVPEPSKPTEKSDLSGTTVKPTPQPLIATKLTVQDKKAVTTPTTTTTTATNMTKTSPIKTARITAGTEPINVICPPLVTFMSGIPTKEWTHLHITMKTALRLEPFLQLYGREIMKDRYCTDQYRLTVLPSLSPKERETYEDLLQLLIQFRTKH